MSALLVGFRPLFVCLTRSSRALELLFALLKSSYTGYTIH